MFRPTSPQRSLLGIEFRLGPEKVARLKRSWAEAWRTHALPLIDEQAFAKYFDAENGRPNKSIRQVVSVLVLKEVHDLTDAEALDDLEFDASWQYALDVVPEEAHACQKTLHNFRRRLLDDDQGQGLFEGTTARLVAAAGLAKRRQRLDSTHTVSNIRLLTRLGLFVETLTSLLRRLREDLPGLLEEVPVELRQRYLDREGYFADARSSEAPRRLQQAARDVWWLVRRFGGRAEVATFEPYQLLARLYAEQVVPPTEEEPERIELQQKPTGGTLQSPSDPDVTYGHKGKGYEVQVAETCEADNPFQVVTAVSVNGANESDQRQVGVMLDGIERTCGEVPETLHADAGYASGENLVAAAERGTDLAAPIGSKASERLALGDFELNDSGTRVVKCPAGEAPIRHETFKSGRTHAKWASFQCRNCPQRSQCPAQRRPGWRVLVFGPADVAVARRRMEQQTKAFKDAHRIRSGIEATNSELKRRHGLRRLRVRRYARVTLAVRLKMLAVNVKRYVRHLAEAAVAACAPAPACAC